MKTIGLLGGMSWESTELYYRLINEGVKTELGGLHSARIALVSVDFQEIETLQHHGDWAGAGQALATAARQVESAGADFLLICTNTADRELVHRVIYDELCLGQVKEASRAEFLRIMADLQERGAEGIIEGCTEIVMLVQQQHTAIPLFDTTAIHAAEAVRFAIAT